jgi:hypothetical protein
MMKNKKNKNAYTGMNTERLIENSIGDQPETIKKLKEKFHIKGDFRNTAGGGIYGDKADIRINFTCGHYIDANIKGYKEGAGFNQLARTSVSKFCKDFNLNSKDQTELENLIVAKSKDVRQPLFTEKSQVKWGEFFKTNAQSLLKWGFSKNQSREILVLYSMDTSVAKIYAIKDVLKRIPRDIVFTKGGFNIGGCISFQRKGGNGSLSNNIPKTTIQHPGNNIQLKVKINKLIPILEPSKLSQYTI